MKYILAIDQGTSSSRVLIYDESFRVLGMAQQPFTQHFPKADWVEHDLEDIWASVEQCIAGALAAVKDPAFSPQKIAAIGITNQRETFGLWERASGRPVARAIVWQCRRSAQICARLRKSAAGRKLPGITGLVLDPYFSGTKLKWMLDQSPSLRARAQKGELAFGTIDTFLIWRLSRGSKHATDVSNASRTLMMDLKKLAWSPQALKVLAVPAALLPEILDSDGDFGATRGVKGLPDGIPIRGVLGDQQAALFGQACFAPGEAKVTYGTGAFMLLNTGFKIRRSRDALSTVAWRMAGQKCLYALEGSVFIAGAAVQWLRDNLGLIQKSSEIEALASSVPDSDGVFFVPALSGLGSPYWAPEARGLIGGLTRRSSKAHVARACLEGVASSVTDLFEGLLKDAKVRVRHLRVDGGACRNNLFMQIQADGTQTRIERPADVESTVRGAAYMAAWGAGLVKDLEAMRGSNAIEARFEPKASRKMALAARKLWSRRVAALLKGAY